MNRFIATLFVLLALTGNSFAAVLVMSPNGTYTTKTTLALAATAADAVGKTVVVTSPQVVTTAIAWPADRELRFERGGYVTFTGSGALTGLKEARPEDFGAIGDGSTVDTTAMTRAIASAKIVSGEPGRSYKINNVALKSDLTIKDMTVVPYTVGSDTAGFAGSAISNLTVDNVTASTPNDATRAERLIKITTSGDNITVKNSKLDFVGLYFYQTANLSIHHNTFENGWGNHTYNASSYGAGLSDGNLARAIDIDNGTVANVNIHNNIFKNVWSAVYASNVNDLTVSNNQITETADTAIFDRCTAGITYNKIISGNTLKNIGKTAIKACDSNNLTGKGHNCTVSNNTIHGYNLFVSGAEAILIANYYDYGGTDQYLKAAESAMSTGIVVTGNTVLATADSKGGAFKFINLLTPVITGNSVDMIPIVGEDDFALQWCTGGVFGGNTVKTAGTIRFYDCARLAIQNNYFASAGAIQVDISANYLLIFNNNYHHNTISATTDSTPYTNYNHVFGLRTAALSGGTISSGIINNNTFKTSLLFQDANASTATSAVGIGTDANAANTTIDSNIIIFGDATKYTKQMFGSLLYPSYYTGIAGMTSFNSTTRVLAIKPSADRVLLDTLTLTD